MHFEGTRPTIVLSDNLKLSLVPIKAYAITLPMIVCCDICPKGALAINRFHVFDEWWRPQLGYANTTNPQPLQTSQLWADEPRGLIQFFVSFLLCVPHVLLNRVTFDVHAASLWLIGRTMLARLQYHATLWNLLLDCAFSGQLGFKFSYSRAATRHSWHDTGRRVDDDPATNQIIEIFGIQLTSHVPVALGCRKVFTVT